VLYLEQVDVVLVVLVVTRSLPQLQVEHIGSNDLVVPPDTVLSANKLDKLVVDLGAVGIPEGTPR
jgi:hypothetical protein